MRLHMKLIRQIEPTVICWPRNLEFEIKATEIIPH